MSLGSLPTVMSGFNRSRIHAAALPRALQGIGQDELDVLNAGFDLMTDQELAEYTRGSSALNDGWTPSSITPKTRHRHLSNQNYSTNSAPNASGSTASLFAPRPQPCRVFSTSSTASLPSSPALNRAYTLLGSPGTSKDGVLTDNSIHTIRNRPPPLRQSSTPLAALTELGTAQPLFPPSPPSHGIFGRPDGQEETLAYLDQSLNASKLIRPLKALSKMARGLQDACFTLEVENELLRKELAGLKRTQDDGERDNTSGMGLGIEIDTVGKNKVRAERWSDASGVFDDGQVSEFDKTILSLL